MEKIKLKKRGLKIIKKSNILLDNENQILKRLEIIKSSISIEENEIIELQIMKLNTIDIDDEVKDILKSLEKSDFSTALSKIESYLSKYSGVVEYIDSEVQGLKLELKSLESNLQKLTEQKTEYLNDIEEFNTQYNIHLGDIIKSILELKKTILYKQTIKQQKEKEKYQEDIQTFQETKETIDNLYSTIEELEEALENIDEDNENYDEIYKAYNELKAEVEKLENELEVQEEDLEKTKEFIEDETIEQEYEDARKTYDQFENEYEHIKDEQDSKIQINDDDKKELKKLFRKAARLCHPDIVVEKLKEKAHELMQKLNEAYSKQDLVQVKKILHSLETGESFEVSSDAIEDKELLKTKIKEYKENIETVKSEIDEIKEDNTYQTIAELDDWDEYFEELRSELQKEKDKLEDEDREILSIQNSKDNNEKEAEEWIQNFWDWADDHNISNDKLSRKKENLLNTKIIDFTGIKLNYLPQEIANLENLQELILWSCELKYLPKDIIKLDKLKKLNLRGNPELSASPSQLDWIDNLNKKAIVFKENIRTIREETVDMFAQPYIEKKKYTKHVEPKKQQQSAIKKEISGYTKHISLIENIKFEKIRKYCENLSKANEADEMQKLLGEKGRMYKALIYSSLETFIEKLDGETITLCDWGCSQGIASMLVLDYIKEKQLDIKVSDVLLIDDDTKVLSRAIAQVEALAQDDINITALKSDDKSILDTIKVNKNSTILNLFANDKIPIDFLDIDLDIFDGDYVLCVSNENKKFVDEVYENFKDFTNVQDMSIRDGKIGRFEKFERIFKIDKDDEIPF